MSDTNKPQARTMLGFTDHHGRARLHFVCSTCGEPIENARHAIAVLLADGTARIVHKSLNGRTCDLSEDAGSFELLETLAMLCRAYDLDSYTRSACSLTAKCTTEADVQAERKG